MAERWWVGPVLGVMLALAMSSASAATPTAARRQQLMNLLTQDCGSCHGLTMKGGLGPPLLPGSLAKTADDVLVDTILHGRPGTPMPPWAFEISPAEAHWLVRRLRAGKIDD